LTINVCISQNPIVKLVDGILFLTSIGSETPTPFAVVGDYVQARFRHADSLAGVDILEGPFRPVRPPDRQVDCLVFSAADV
jgi:hypothetical protein